MTIQERKLLMTIKKLTNNSELEFYYVSFDKALRVEGQNNSINCGKLSPEINGILKSLHAKGYITRIDTCGLDSDHYCLTHKGLHRFQIFSEKTLCFLLCSVITPILVSIATTLFTLWLTTLLSQP